MKRRDVVVGGRYGTRVGAQIVSVVVLGEAPAPPPHPYSTREPHPRLRVRNEATGRELVRTAAALRPLPAGGVR